MSEPTTSDVLREAAKRIMARGWWQAGVDGAPKEAECVLLSIAHQGLPSSLTDSATDAVCSHLDLMSPRSPIGDWAALTAWNDAPERTAEDVILALKQAAYDLDEAS